MSPRIWIAIAIFLAGIGAGWSVNDWRRDAQEVDRLAAEKVTLAEQLAGVEKELKDEIVESNTQIKRVADRNNTEAELIGASLTEAREITDDILKIQLRAASANAGTCDFTDDADSLRAEAYRRATAARRRPASGETGGAHGGDPRPGSTDAVERPAGQGTGPSRRR